MSGAGAPPGLPPARTLELPGRGRAFARHLPGPPGAPTVLLLHGLGATADLNWFTAYEALGRHFGVVAVDHRGHGRGIRSRRPFRLEDCADDAAAVAEALGAGPVVAVGYSMGGPVAQLMWRRHPRLVAGLVLCATSRNFGGHPAARLFYATLPPVAAAVRLTPPPLRRAAVARMAAGRAATGPLGDWAASELRRANPVAMVEAVAALGRFSSHRWIGEVDVPTAVVVTEQDRVVSSARQRKLAASIPGARIHSVDGDHAACVLDAGRFVPALVAACREVAAQGSAVPR